MQLFDPIVFLESEFSPNTCHAIYLDHQDKISIRVYGQSGNCLYQDILKERQFSEQSHLQWYIQRVKEKLVAS